MRETVQHRRQPHSRSGFRLGLQECAARRLRSMARCFCGRGLSSIVFALESESLSAAAAYVAKLGVISRLSRNHARLVASANWVIRSQPQFT